MSCGRSGGRRSPRRIIARHGVTPEEVSKELERAELVDEPVDPDPMVSLRLPKSLLDWVRAQARTEHTKPTQLIRRWIEERRATGQPSLEERVRRLEDLVQRGPGNDS